MAALPEWPGFRRLSLTDEDSAAVRLFQAELDAFEQEFLADADEVSRSIDEQGITRIEARFDLTKRGGR